jgi:hypothetical protein
MNTLGVDHDAGQIGRHRNVCMLAPSAPCEAKLTICNGLLNAHDPKLERYFLELIDILGQLLCLDGGLVDSFQVGANHFTEIGEMRETAFTVKKRTA